MDTSPAYVEVGFDFDTNAPFISVAYLDDQGPCPLCGRDYCEDCWTAWGRTECHECDRAATCAADEII